MVSKIQRQTHSQKDAYGLQFHKQSPVTDSETIKKVHLRFHPQEGEGIPHICHFSSTYRIFG